MATVVVLGPVGANFGAGMTGGRAYLYDPSGRHTAALDDGSVQAVRLATALAERPDGQARLIELIRLLEAHRAAGSALAARVLRRARARRDVLAGRADRSAGAPSRAGGRAGAEPDRNPSVPVSTPTAEAVVPTLERPWDPITPG